MQLQLFPITLNWPGIGLLHCSSTDLIGFLHTNRGIKPGNKGLDFIFGGGEGSQSEILKPSKAGTWLPTLRIMQFPHKQIVEVRLPLLAFGIFGGQH